MRHLLSHAAVAALMVALTGTAGLAQPPDTVRVRIGGSAQVVVRLVPTRAVMYLLVESTAPTVEEAVNQTARASSGVIDTLRRTGGADELSLVEYGVVPTLVNYPTPAANQRNGYTSRAAVRFVASLSRVQALTSAAYVRGASASAAPQFLHEGVDTAVARALEQATALARQRAEAVARGLGGRLGALIGIDSHPAYNEYSQPTTFPPPQGYDHQPRPVPEIKHTVNVNGAWVFVPR